MSHPPPSCREIAHTWRGDHLGYDSTAARRTPQFVKSAPYPVVYPGPSASIFKPAPKGAARRWPKQRSISLLPNRTKTYILSKPPAQKRSTRPASQSIELCNC
jgi:hypothetical protein